MSATPAITLENFTVSYGRRAVVRRVCGCFERGSLTAIVGANGAGKSTLLKAIVGLLQPVHGRIQRHGIDCRRDLAYLPQQPDIDRSFPINVADTVAAGLWHEVGAFGAVRPAAATRIAAALALVGLEGLESHPVGSLSAGQFQRLLFARLALQAAPVVALDEPFSAIDARTTAQLLGLLQAWHADGRTIIAVLHDLDQVRRHFPQSLLLARELIAWGATAEVLTPANLMLMRHLSADWDGDPERGCRRSVPG